MGKLILPICNSCDEIFLPISFGSDERNLSEDINVPFYCDYCSTILTNRVLDEKHQCPTCDKELVMYGKFRGYFDDIDENEEQIIYFKPNRILFECTIAMDLEYILEEIDYHCPKCKKESLRFNLNEILVER